MSTDSRTLPPPWVSEVVRTFLCGTHDMHSPLQLLRGHPLLEKIVRGWWCWPGVLAQVHLAISQYRDLDSGVRTTSCKPSGHL